MPMVDFIYHVRSHFKNKRKYDSYFEKLIAAYYMYFPSHKTGIKKIKEPMRSGGGYKKDYGEIRVVVSMTTIIKRIDTSLKMAVESVLRQSYKPDAFCLYITDKMTKEERQKFETDFSDQINRGLQIHYVKDVGPHTKYFYALQEYKDSLVVTVDDDIIYAESLIKELIEGYKNFPNHICCTRTHRVTFDSKNHLNKYGEWDIHENRKFEEPNISYRNFITGVGGVLYPAWIFKKDLFDVKNMMELTPTGDDIWIYMNAIYHHLQICNIMTNLGYTLSISSGQNITLGSVNTKANDKMLSDMEKFLGKTCYEIIEENETLHKNLDILEL